MSHNNEHIQEQEITYENSFPFDVIRYREVSLFKNQQIKMIVDTVWDSLPFKPNPKVKDRAKYREMVKNYVLNLLKAYQTRKYIRISRNRNDHFYDERYCHIYTTASIVINTMDSLHEHNWIDMSIGFYDRQRQYGKQTRISPSVKFKELIEQMYGVFNGGNIQFVNEETKELIQLRKKIDADRYKLIPYKDNYITRPMRERLNRYNDLMSSYMTILPLSRKDLSTMDNDLITMFNNLLLNGSIAFSTKEINNRSISKRRRKKMDESKQSKRNKELIIKESSSFDIFECERELNNDLKHKSLPRTTTETSPTAGKEGKAKDTTITNTLAQHDKHKHTVRKNLLLSEDEQIGEVYYTIDEILKAYPKYRIFKFIIHHKNVYRAFSDSDMNFNHHGRFYGDVIQSLPEWMRIKITMKGQSVVECDYKSLHPTLLYAKMGVVPPDNIYVIDKEDDEQLRKEYKAILLISINHKDPKTMWNVVSSGFRKNFGYRKGDERLSKKYIEDIYDQLLLHNQPIAKFMNTGIGLELMRKDSEIADRIINDFVKRKAPIRCIHDSFIVPAGYYESLLKKLMVKHFQVVMNTDFTPDITTDRVQEKAIKRPVLNVQVEAIPAVMYDEEVPVMDDYDENMMYFESPLHEQHISHPIQVSNVPDTEDIEDSSNEYMKYFENNDDSYSFYDYSTHGFLKLPKERVLLGENRIMNRFEGIKI